MAFCVWPIRTGFRPSYHWRDPGSASSIQDRPGRVLLVQMLELYEPVLYALSAIDSDIGAKCSTVRPGWTFDLPRHESLETDGDD